MFFVESIFILSIKRTATIRMAGTTHNNYSYILKMENNKNFITPLNPNINKLINYFLGYHNRPILYTILGFQKNISSESDYNNLGISLDLKYSNSNKNNFISYFLAFNHQKCKIEYYLINYGLPYILTKKNIPLEISERINIDFNENIINSNRIQIDFDNSPIVNYKNPHIKTDVEKKYN